MTNIEWTDKTWNPIVGCSIVSKGCTNCYAMKFAGQRLDGNPKSPHYAGTTQKSNAGAVWTGKVALAPEAKLTEPLKWKKPCKVFVNSMGDLFHESVPDEWIDQVFAVMALCPQHTFQVLTKRPERMMRYVLDMPEKHLTWAPRAMGAAKIYRRAEALAGDLGKKYGGTSFAGLLNRHLPDGFFGMADTWPLPNIWLGVSVENQDSANERIPLLLDTPAAVRFISAEPLLGAVDISSIQIGTEQIKPLAGLTWYPTPKDFACQGLTARKSEKIDWVICGGESGPGARPMHPDWARSLRNQCQAAGVPFFFKQWGNWKPLDEDDNKRDWFILYPDGIYDIPDHCWPDEDAGECRIAFSKSKSGRLLDGAEHNGFPRRVG